MKHAKRINAAAALTLAAVTTFGVGLAGTVTAAPRAYAVTQQEYQQKLDEQSALKAKLTGVSQSLTDQILQLNDLTQNQIPAAEKAAQQAQQDAQQAKDLAETTAQRLQAAQKDKADLQAKIKQTGMDYDDAKAAVAQLARDSFHGSDASTVMEVVTKATTTTDFVNKMQSEAAVTRSEANAASAAADSLNVSENRQQRLDAIESEISTLKQKTDEQAASAQVAAESAQTKQSQLESLRSQGTAARSSLEQQKSSLTTKSAQEAADIVALKSQIDSYAATVPTGSTTPDPGSGGSQQIGRGGQTSSGGGTSSGGSSNSGSGGSSNSGSSGAVGMNYAVPGSCAEGSSYCYGHYTGNTVGGSAYPALNCTLWAYIRRSQLRLPVGSYMGDGAQWASNARSMGYLVNNTPHVGAVMVFARGQRVTSWNADWQYGHVAVVERVNSDGSVIISEGGTGFPSFPYAERVYNASNYQFIHY
ncbi:MAG: CHAP domain-containing protein [Bifidobacterium sp.]|jgi:surface antigen|nr:CHAP domain-containing protein [Bifidobacterium sp.]MCI1865168.1 CHAP domain-containing protein [Bifidobacterium sp.]